MVETFCLKIKWKLYLTSTLQRDDFVWISWFFVSLFAFLFPQRLILRSIIEWKKWKNKTLEGCLEKFIRQVTRTPRGCITQGTVVCLLLLHMRTVQQEDGCAGIFNFRGGLILRRIVTFNKSSAFRCSQMLLLLLLYSSFNYFALQQSHWYSRKLRILPFTESVSGNSAAGVVLLEIYIYVSEK